MKLVTIMGLEQ